MFFAVEDIWRAALCVPGYLSLYGSSTWFLGDLTFGANLGSFFTMLLDSASIPGIRFFSCSKINLYKELGLAFSAERGCRSSPAKTGADFVAVKWPVNYGGILRLLNEAARLFDTASSGRLSGSCSESLLKAGVLLTNSSWNMLTF